MTSKKSERVKLDSPEAFAAAMARKYEDPHSEAIRLLSEAVVHQSEFFNELAQKTLRAINDLKSQENHAELLDSLPPISPEKAVQEQ